MQAPEFDATLGGTEHLPFSVNSLKFAASRSVEIAAMTESILRPSMTKLIFQCLPVHMRRRVMSHNCKRLPKKLREGHLEQLKKSGLPPKQKRPSRKYRRRPGNLLEDYNRRQKRNVWLETHIWHAKRFHMKERWGHKLAYAPCDKAFRACYRASSAHCLLQDISYFTPILITGAVEDIKQTFKSITSPACGLGICAKAYVSGRRQGSIHLYNPNSYPFGFIGKLDFIWTVDSSNIQLWLFVHPSQVKEVEVVLSEQLTCNNEDIEQAAKRLKLNNCKQSIQFQLMLGTFNRFRLTGPNSHAVLVRSLKCVDDVEKIQSNEWVSLTKKELKLKEKVEFWKNISLASSPSQLTPNMIAGLVVRDPRLSRPTYRTKAKYQNSQIINVETLVNVPSSAAHSPIWDVTTHQSIKQNRLTNTQFIEHITKTQLVPGEMTIEDPALQSVPVVLVQRPGSQNPKFKKLGYGSGWDIIVPSGYGLPFWQTFIMFGARAGGLRETESLAFESGECFLPPDSNAGMEEEKRIETELKDRYFKLPPSKRVNHVKFAINTPFICPWRILLQDWCNCCIDNLFVVRDRQILDSLQDCILTKKKLPNIEKPECLVAVYLQIAKKGNLKKHALICLPETEDLKSINCIFEPHHEDPNEDLRKRKRREHTKMLKSLRRRRIKMKNRNEAVKKPKSQKTEPSDYVKAMRELWLPSNVTTVRNSCSRQVMGYLSQGAFSFSQARSCGVGYITYNALKMLLEKGLNQVLVRNTTSRNYRLANIQIIKDA